VSEVSVHVPDITPETRALIARSLDMAGVAPGALTVSRADASVAILAATMAGMRLGGARRVGIRCCRVCGCSLLIRCSPDDPCKWVQTDLCSACEPFVEASL